VPSHYYLCDEKNKPEGCFTYQNPDFSKFTIEQMESLRPFISNQAQCEHIRKQLLDLLKIYE